LSLKQQTFSAIRWSTLAMVGQAGLSFIQLAILARALAPSDFGVMALVVAILAFTQIFTDMGVSNAIIHHQNISKEELSSLYWLNVCSGGIFMLLLMVLSYPLMTIYQEPLLQPLLMLISINFLIGALGRQLSVVAEKELRFSGLAKIELFSAAIGFVTAVIWVWLSPTVFALAVGSIASTLTTTILCWMMLANGWRPMLRLRLKEIRHFLSFGGYTMADNFINTFNLQADIFIGGRLLSIETLGVYSLSRNLSLKLAGVINPIVTRVGLPVMAKTQHDVTFLRNVYLKTLRMTASINFPLYLAVAIFAPEIVILIFGDKWIEATPLLHVFALWGILRSIGNPVGSLIYATGRAGLSFKWNMAMFIFTIPVVWFGSQWGAMGIALSLLGKGVFMFIPGWFFLVRPLCGAGLWQYTVSLLIPLVAAVIASSVAYLSVYLLIEPIIRLAVGSLVGGIVYLLVSMLINKQWVGAMKELVLKR